MPTKEQIEQIKEIARKDCKVAGRYWCHNENTCILGALALEAGVPKEDLRKYGSRPIWFLLDLICRIETKFGLDSNHQCKLQRINDDYNDVETRREAIINYLDAL